MISSELLRRYPFFAGLSHDQLTALAMTADEYEFAAGHRFFSEGDELDYFYLVTEGDVGIVFEVPDSEVKQTVAAQLTGEIKTKDLIISRVRPGEPFGWTAIAREGGATAGAVALVDSKVVLFDMDKLLEKIEEDPTLGCTMLQHILRSVRQRLHDLRMETMVNR